MSEASEQDGRTPQGVLAGPGTIAVIAGLTFAISDERGDIGPGPFGLITDDIRHLSCPQVRVNSEPLQHLGSGLVSLAVARSAVTPCWTAGYRTRRWSASGCASSRPGGWWKP